MSLERLVKLGETTDHARCSAQSRRHQTKHPVKILGDGELKVAITVHAHKFSKSAQEKSPRHGGKFEVLAVTLEKLANIFRIPDLRRRILFTLGLLLVYRLGGHIPTPG